MFPEQALPMVDPAHGDRVSHLEVSSTVAHTAVGKLLLQVLCRRLAPLSGVNVQD